MRLGEELTSSNVCCGLDFVSNKEANKRCLTKFEAAVLLSQPCFTLLTSSYGARVLT